MNMGLQINNILRKSRLSELLKRNLPIAAMLMAGSLVSCTDDLIPDTPGNGERPDYGNLVTIELPGYLGINITNTGNMATRAEGATTPSDGNGFDDGFALEYDFAPGVHHYVVVYEKNKDNRVPLAIMPLDLDDAEIDGPQTSGTFDNITLTAKTVVTGDKMTPTVWSKNYLASILDGNEVYVLVNFDASNINLGSSSTIIDPTKTTPEILYGLTRSQFLTLPISDYKITVKKNNVNTDFFTMANSVYVDNGNVKVDYSVEPENIFETVDEAKDDPAITVHVERLAAKYTVDFTEGVKGKDENDNDILTSPGYFGLDSDGHPFYTLKINEYDGFVLGQGYTLKSKPADATIHVLGYAVNNIEPTSTLIKKINATTYFTSTMNSGSWNDAGSFRCYWSEDPHYKFEASSGHLANAKGYPHQFRQALETDTVLQYHGRNYIYSDPEHKTSTVRRTVTVTDDKGNVTTEERDIEFYEDLGSIDTTSINTTNCYLKYRSYGDMMAGYGKAKAAYESRRDQEEFNNSFAFYSLENTYYDTGMATGTNSYANPSNFTWNWLKAPYSAATNLTVLCELRILRNGTETATTVYRGQNNIFYFDLHELLQSKVDILNQLVLDAGNAGLDILHFHLTSHGNEDSGFDSFHDSYLDKVAWNRNSVLWIGKCQDDGTEIEDTETEPGHWEATADDMELIPAEISGGDGQCLIAPKYMGKNYKFYLAPVYMIDNVAVDYAGNPIPHGGKYVRDKSQSVEINYNHLVALIHKGIGPIDVFTEGKMYYSIPISHRIQSLDMTGNNPSWQTLGNIGVVRNNWYEITVGNISEIGTPVHDINQPIVPVMDVKRSYINANIQIYKWHSFKQENIPMQ